MPETQARNCDHLFILGDQTRGLNVPAFVGANFQGLTGDTLADYCRRCRVAVPVGEKGGGVAVEHPQHPRIIRVDLCASQPGPLPHVRTIHAALVILAAMDYDYLITECWRHPKLERYWQRVGLQLTNKENRIYSICLKQ